MDRNHSLLWDINARVKFGGQKIKVQGHGASKMLENALFSLVDTCIFFYLFLYCMYFEYDFNNK